MQYIADLHLHSRYSRAVSKNMNLSTMAQVATEKGIDILAAADWTHPLWLKEIQGQLTEAGEGVYRLKSQISNVKFQISNREKEPFFILSTEIASIYKQGDKLHRIHNLVFAPDFAAVDAINQALMKRGANLISDGRPIVGLSSHDLLELILSVSEQAFLIPCHVWTPHFGLYGSASGFDSIQEAFGDLSQYIYAIETGLSSDPEMNWQIPELADRSIVSFSDAHSLPKMGREATAFELNEETFSNIKKAIMQPRLSVLGSQLSVSGSSVTSQSVTEHPKTGKLQSENRKQKTDNRVSYTIEFYPEEGKYHYSGHRNCHVSFGPDEIREKGNVCPVCHRRMTEGVFFRLQHLAGKAEIDSALLKKDAAGLVWYIDPHKIHPPYIRLVPLLEIIAEVAGVGVGSKRVQQAYKQMIQDIGPELTILLKTPLPDIANKAGEKVAEAIGKVRSGDIVIKPGFDGEYGKVSIWPESNSGKSSQMGLSF